jgi:hypothetical protein
MFVFGGRLAVKCSYIACIPLVSLPLDAGLRLARCECWDDDMIAQLDFLAVRMSFGVIYSTFTAVSKPTECEKIP